jgi:hypothetical protein
MFSGLGRPNQSASRIASATARVIPWIVVASVGCAQTHYPSILPSASENDRRSFNVHDPLPETNIAPDMASRPRDFTNEWAEPRRTQEAQQLLGVPPGGAPPVPAGAPAGPGMAPGAPMVAPQGAPITPGAPTGQMYPGPVPQ